MKDVSSLEEPGARLRELRRRRGLTQEALAEAAGLSVQCIKKIEGGGTARMETYRQIAKVLSVQTIWFISPGSPPPVTESGTLALLADMRAAITPGIGIDGAPLYGTADWDEVNLPRLRDAVDAVALAYHADRYDHIAQVLPSLIRSAQFHVTRFDDGPESVEALRLRSDALALAGRWLIQVGAHDLALTALRQSLRDALGVEDIPRAASTIAHQGWAMIRQGRFGEVEALCAHAAQEVEPRVSEASVERLAAWGWLLIRAASAAARNNRAPDAGEYLSLARTAAARVGTERKGLPGHRAFGPVSVDLMRAEVAMVSDEPAQALAVMEGIDPAAGRPYNSTWNRGQLERARALVDVGDADQATEVLQELKAKSPEWLRYQQRARDVAERILRARTRMPSAQQREVADFLGVGG